MKRNDVETKLIALLHEAGIYIMPEQYDAPLKEMGVDSLEFVEVIMNVEIVFGIEIGNSQAVQLLSVNDFITFITRVKQIEA